MSTFINNVIVALVGFVVTAGLLLSAAVKDGATGPEVRGVDATWAPGPAGPQLSAILHVANDGRARADLVRIDYRLDMNDQPLAGGTIARHQTFMPGTESQVPLLLPIDGNVATAWWGRLLRGEPIELRLRGGINSTIGPTTHEEPFEWSAQYLSESRPQVPSLAHRNVFCPMESDRPCLQSVAPGTILDPLALPVGVTLRAPSFTSAELRNFRVSLVLGETVVAQSPTIGASLPSGYEALLPIDLIVSTTALPAWWPSHVANCEASPVVLQIDYDAALTNWTGTRSAHVVESLPGDAWRTPMLCRDAT